MEEIWKDIIIEKNNILYDYTGLYQVSNHGRIRSLNYKGHHGREHMLKLKLNNNGYESVALHKKGKRKDFLVHRLVATMFIPNPDNLPQVNHKNELKTDNVWTNLEWCTNKYNTKYSSHKWKGENHPMYGIKDEDAPNTKKVLCLETKQVFISIKKAQVWLGKGDIAQCLRGRSKTAGGYHWMYYDDYKKDLRKESDIKNTQLVA